MARSRVDDEEALIPRSDEEYHPTPKARSKQGRCRCCSIKCCFFLFFLLVVGTSVLFYFVYPSVVNENFNKFLGFACSYTQLTTTVTCVIMTSKKTLDTQGSAINATWGQHCAVRHYIGSDVDPDTSSGLGHVVVGDVSTWKYLDALYNEDDVTEWYLVVDDLTFVSYGKLEKRLLDVQGSEPLYLGCDTDTPCMVNAAGVKAIKEQIGYGAMNVTAGLTAANITRDSQDRGLYAEYPEDVKGQLMTMKSASLFTGVDADLMYTLFVTSPDNV